ncbi:PAS domain-containing sensor histidine kinase [Ramlibacter rhizophilus]|uniref:histidine kinase n=1 Tax=Ramlibacter rhizophilus TaxID=1781167 RepID=A0A4Z0C2D6_9BURK|nr:PAS domain-containing sensor histidine kinase [Ramlibacter rhizophilus]TFZ04379.1 PAS domain S-box protein [Ramlibacter rhizophilus]
MSQHQPRPGGAARSSERACALPSLPAGIPAAGIPAVLEQCLRHAPAFIALVMGRQHVFAFVNDAYAEWIGQPASELCGRPAFDVLSGVRGQGFEELLDRLWTTREPYVGRGVAVRIGTRPDARELFADLVFQPVFDERGDMAGIFLQWHDVTERHRLGEAQRLAAQNQDVFLTKLVHELRTPVAAIRGAMEVLARRPGQVSGPVERMVRIVRHQAGSIGSLIDELADLASVKLGRSAAPMTDCVVLQDVVRHAVEACTPLLDARGHALRVLMPEPDVVLQGDALRLDRALCNLLTNAAKYTAPGGRIEVQLSCARQGAVICVSDNGIGLARPSLERIFDLFHQEEAGTDARQGGLGIGLALVRQIAQAHGGSVQAHSDGPGRGASFVLKLPTARS